MKLNDEQILKIYDSQDYDFIQFTPSLRNVSTNKGFTPLMDLEILTV